MSMISELAKKPSSEVFKRENSRTRSSTNLLQSLQRSTSGLNISTSASTSSFSTTRNEIEVGQPFGIYRTPLQESKSMKNIANVRILQCLKMTKKVSLILQLASEASNYFTIRK